LPLPLNDYLQLLSNQLFIPKRVPLGQSGADVFTVLICFLLPEHQRQSIEPNSKQTKISHIVGVGLISFLNHHHHHHTTFVVRLLQTNVRT